MPRSFNLSNLAQELKKRGEHLDLARQIDSQTHTASRLADLLHAAELMALLAQLQQNRAEVPREGSARDAFTDAEGAVLAHAIVLYVRATSTGDQGRTTTFRIEEVLSSDLVAVHRALRATRNKAVAHVDAQDKQDWHTDCLVMVRHENGDWHYGSPYSRTSYRSSIHQALKVVLDALAPRVDELSKRSMDDLNTRLQEAIKADAALDALIEAFPFDDEAFYGRSPEATAVTKMMLGGGEGNFVWHTTTVKKAGE